MELPIERAEWEEVVIFAGANPWQTVPAMYVSRAALAQRTIGIVNTCLREEAEHYEPVLEWPDAVDPRPARTTPVRDIGVDANGVAL